MRCQLSRVGWLQLVEQSQNSEAIPLGNQHVLQGSYVSLIVSAPSSVCMSQMLGCASRGWEHGQKQVLWEPGPVAGRGNGRRRKQNVMACGVQGCMVGTALWVLSPAALETDSRGHRA